MFLRAVLTSSLLLALLPAARAELPPAVAEQLARIKVPEDAMAGMVIRLADGALLMSHQPDRSLQPASTMKLVSTTVGLNKLGPLFRGRTALMSGAEIRRGALHGDLVLRGGADTDLDWQALQGMLQTLRHQGIKTIHGDLLIDRSLYQPARMDMGVAPFDEAPEFRYNTIPDALNLNLNLVKLTLSANMDALDVNMMPALENVSIRHEMSLSDAPCKDWGDGWLPPTIERKRDRLQIVLHGSYPKNCEKTTEINILDRTEYAARLFKSLWRQMDGSFKGEVREASAPAGLRVLTEHRSRPLAELLRDINKASDNTFARMLFLNMGTFAVDSAITGNVTVLAREPVDTLQRSDREVRAWFRQHGIDDAGMVLENGSGLSRKERLTPRQLASLLQVGYNSIWAPELMASLPLSAMDGTMRSRLKDSPAAGRARIKTGSLKNVIAVAGFVLDAQGRQCIVVGMINADTMKWADGRAVLDSLIDWVARSGGSVLEVMR